jgi:hypothetical protein
VSGRGETVWARGLGGVGGRTTGGATGVLIGRAGADTVAVAVAVAVERDGAGARDAETSRAAGANSSSIELPAPIVMTPPHTEHRARSPIAGIFAGSTRNTDRHSGHETFTSPPSLWPSHARSRLSSARRPALRRFVDRSKRRNPGASSRSSSFQSRARSPAPRA